MNKNRVLGLAAACLLFGGLTGSAAADSIAFSSLPGSDTFTATSINITNPGGVGSIVGTYWSGLGSGCSSCTTFSPTSWSSGGGTETLTIVSGAFTDIISITSYSFSGTDSNMTILGSGTSSINGGLAQLITFSLTTQLAAGTAVGTSTSFSGSVSTVPLPPALFLFGSGLVGLVALGKKRKQRAQLVSA